MINVPQKGCSEETGIITFSSYQSHTRNRRSANMMITRLRASPRHGGKGDFFIFFLNYLLPIRRGGVPSGAAAFIVPD